MILEAIRGGFPGAGGRSLASALPFPTTSAALSPPLLSRQLSAFVFDDANFRAPKLPSGLAIRDVPVERATEESLKGLGRLVTSADAVSVERGNFEIKRWPVSGWRSLDPNTGDEAGTTEGHFDVCWAGDFYYGTNLAVNTTNNVYLDGLGALPENASEDNATEPTHIYLWMSDYHPDGGQMFWAVEPSNIEFVVCLGPSAKGDDIKPDDMRAFLVPAGKGIYLEPGTWHNGIYVGAKDTPARFLTRQGRVHARVSASWADEFHTLLRLRLP